MADEPKHDYPQDDTECCSHEPVPGQSVTERCPDCKHYYLKANDRLICSWPLCISYF